MDQNPQQPNEMPPASAPGQPSAGMPPTTNYPMTTGGGMVSQDDKSQAMLMWILTIFFGFIPGLIFFLTAKDKPYTNRQSALSLTWSIIAAVLYFATIILAVVTLGLGAILVPAIGVIHLVVCIMGAVATSKGDDFNPPVITNLTKSIFKV